MWLEPALLWSSGTWWGGPERIRKVNQKQQCPGAEEQVPVQWHRARPDQGNTEFCLSSPEQTSTHKLGPLCWNGFSPLGEGVYAE